jgi:hypothetical protein
MNNNWPLYEVFIRSKQGLDHKHVGSLHAADPQMAIENDLFMLQIRMTLLRFTNLQTIKFIAILHFTICRMN